MLVEHCVPVENKAIARPNATVARSELIRNEQIRTSDVEQFQDRWDLLRGR